VRSRGSVVADKLPELGQVFFFDRQRAPQTKLMIAWPYFVDSAQKFRAVPMERSQRMLLLGGNDVASTLFPVCVRTRAHIEQQTNLAGFLIYSNARVSGKELPGYHADALFLNVFGLKIHGVVYRFPYRTSLASCETMDSIHSCGVAVALGNSSTGFERTAAM